MKKRLFLIPLAAFLLVGCGPTNTNNNNNKGGGDVQTATLVSIAVTTNPSQLTYTEGETFNPAGMVVTGTFDDGSTKVITGYSVPNQPLTVSTKSVTISYQGKTVSIPVTVNPRLTPRETFVRAKTNTYENSIYEYTYNLEAKIKFAGALNFSPVKFSGVTQYDESAQDTKYMHKQDASGILVFDYTTYTYNKGTDLIKVNANENKDFSVVNSEKVPSNYDFDTNSVGFILKALADNDNLSVTKSGDKYNLALKTSFKNDFLKILNYIDSQKILNALSDLTEQVWGVSFSCDCYVKLDSTQTKVSDFHFGVSVNVKDIVEIALDFDQHFSKVGSGVKIALPEFQNTVTSSEGIQNELNTIGTALYSSRPNYYNYNVHTKVDHGVSKGNPLGLGVDSTSKGFAEREIIDNKVYFHNELEVDSDYKNKDQYPDDIEDYKLTRAKVNDGVDSVYDVEDHLIGKDYYEINPYNNDAIDDYYMLPNESCLSTSAIPILRKTQKDTKTTYRLGLTTNGIKDILSYYNKSIRLDKEGVKWIDVYEITSGFSAKKCDLEFEIENGLINTIEGHMKGFYVLENEKQVKFEFDLEIEFKHDKKAYTAPTKYKDIDA